MGRWIKRIVLGLGALVLLAVAAAATFVLTFDAADYKQEIAGAFEAATGRKLHFGGKVEANILTLQPAITLHDASLLNPPGYSRPALATAKRMHLIVRLRPLLNRRIAIVRLEVEGGDVLFEQNEKGERNWREKAEAPPPLTAIPPPVMQVPGVKIGTGQPVAGLTVDRLLLRNVRIAYLHAPTKLESSMQLDEVTVTIPAFDKPVVLAVAGTYQGAKIRTTGQVGSLAELLTPRGGPSFPLALKIAFGRSELDVDVKADLTARVPTAAGRITAKHVDLDELSPPSAPGTKQGDGRLFSTTPLPLGILNAFDASGEISIESLVLRRQRFSGVSAKIALKGGDLAATSFGFTLAGARIAGALRINAASIPAVSVRASGSGVRLREVTQVLFERATMSSNVTFTIDVNGRGRSMREIAASLSGPVVISLGPGPINANVLDFLSKDIFSIHRGGELSLVCALARFDFARGIGSSRRIVIDTTRATAYGSGWVSLGSETLDMTFAPTTKGKSLASVAAIVPVRVHGPLVKPNAAPDLSKTPAEVAKSVLGVVELPGEIVSSIFGRSSQATRAAGCGGDAATGVPATRDAQKEKPGLLDRGGDVLKKLNPFQ